MSNTYSYSKLDTYQQCPFKFKLKYVDGHYSFNSSIHTEIGTAIHSCEEQIAKSIQANKPINYIKLKNELILKMNELQNKYPVDFLAVDKAGNTFTEKIYYYLETGIYKLEEFMKNHPTYEIVGIEQSFKITYKSGQVFNGFIDRIFHDKLTNTYLIQDIKTYPVAVEHDKLATPLQFVIYTLAVQDLYKCSLEQISCQYYLPFCDLTQNAGTAGYINRGTIKLDKLFENIDAGEYTPHQSPLCNYCEFCKTNPDAKEDSKYLCPYFSLWERTTRNKYDISKVAHKWEGLEKHEAIMENYLQEERKVID